MTFPDVESPAQSPVNLTRQKRQLADQAIAQASAAKWAEAAATNRKLLELGPDAEVGEPAGQVALGARRAPSRPRALPDRAGARSHQPDRRAQHRPAEGAAGGRRREDGPGPGGQQGAGQHLRRGDRQDRLRLPDRPRRPTPARPGQSGRLGRAHARGQPADRPQQRRSGSASSSRASPLACSS